MKDGVYEEILLDSAIKSIGIAGHHISSFEYFVDTNLQKIIDSESIIEPVIKPYGVEDFKIKLGKITVGKPDILEADSIVRPIMPMEARIRDLTYDAPMMLGVSYIADKKVVAEEEVFIGRLPVMVKSKYCNLYGLSDEELLKAKEDPKDPGGYFIISGTERIIITTEDLAPNNILISRENQEGVSYSAKIFADADSIKVPHTIQLSDSNLLYLTFGKLKKISLVVMLKALGFTNENQLIKEISKGDDDIENTISINMTAFDVNTEKEALELIGKSLHSVHAKDTAEKNIDSLLLPFLGRDQDSRKTKGEYLIYVTSMLLKYAIS